MAASKQLAQLLELPAPKRARLASALIHSLDGPPDEDADQKWAEEIGRRVDDLRRGAVGTVSWAEVRARLRPRSPRR